MSDSSKKENTCCSDCDCGCDCCDDDCCCCDDDCCSTDNDSCCCHDEKESSSKCCHKH